ncbi:MAG: hypothetical protein WCL02_02000 [bacterium]
MQSIVAQMPKAALAGQDKDFAIDTPDDQKDMISKYSDDLTQIAKDGKLKEVIGREKEFAKMVEILCRKEKNNVVIL